MNFSRGCDAVLGIMGPLSAPSSPSSHSYGSDGYHSDPDQTIEDNGDSEMVDHYRMLYNENRTQTLDALNGLQQLKHVYHLKTKILFSIIVVRQSNRRNHTLIMSHIVAKKYVRCFV